MNSYFIIATKVLFSVKIKDFKALKNSFVPKEGKIFEVKKNFPFISWENNIQIKIKNFAEKSTMDKTLSQKVEQELTRCY